jgi:hypothetical protein
VLEANGKLLRWKDLPPTRPFYLLSDNMEDKRTDKIIRAGLYTILTSQWLRDCIEQSRLLAPKPYVLVSPLGVQVMVAAEPQTTTTTTTSPNKRATPQAAKTARIESSSSPWLKSQDLMVGYWARTSPGATKDRYEALLVDSGKTMAQIKARKRELGIA